MLRILKSEFEKKVSRFGVSSDARVVVEFMRGDCVRDETIETGYVEQKIHLLCDNYDAACCATKNDCVGLLEIQVAYEYEFDIALPLVNFRQPEHSMRKTFCVVAGKLPVVIDDDDMVLSDDDVCRLIIDTLKIDTCISNPDFFYKLKGV